MLTGGARDARVKREKQRKREKTGGVREGSEGLSSDRELLDR